MAPLTQPPLLAQQFRPDPGIHNRAGISGAPGRSGDSLAPNAYQSIQVQETLPASLRGTNPSIGGETQGRLRVGLRLRRAVNVARTGTNSR